MKKMERSTKYVLVVFLVLVVLAVVFLSLSTYKKEPATELATPQKETVRVVSQEEVGKVVEEIQFQKSASLPDMESEQGRWHQTGLRVEESYETTYIVLSYTNALATPTAALLYNPGFTESYSPIYLNDNLDGKVIFEVAFPEKGYWSILLLEEGYVGTYRAYVMEKGAYYETKTLPEEREIPQ